MKETLEDKIKQIEDAIKNIQRRVEEIDKSTYNDLIKKIFKDKDKNIILGLEIALNILKNDE